MKPGQYDWILEIPEAEKHLPEIYSLIAQEIGIGNLLKLIAVLKKTMVYFTTGPIIQLAKIYIMQNNHINPPELARKLDVSLQFVYEVLASARKNNNQKDLFDASK